MRHFGGGLKQKKDALYSRRFYGFSFSCSRFFYLPNQATVNEHYKPEDLVDGYAPFCKHLFIPNKWNVLNNIIEITPEIEPLIRYRLLFLFFQE